MTDVETTEPRYAIDELPEFLGERLAEDEDGAKRAAFGWGATWHYEMEDEWPTVHADGKRDMVECEDEDVTRHIARWDPARVLAEIEAKRQIIARHARVRFGPTRCHCCWDNEWDDDGVPLFPCLSLRAQGAPWAGHEDYREEWRP